MVMDFISKDIGRLLYRYPDVPLRYLMFSDFFIHTGQYDLILEQSFFCFIDSSLMTATLVRDKRVPMIIKRTERVAGSFNGACGYAGNSSISCII
jgi:hypothetical protein